MQHPYVGEGTVWVPGVSTKQNVWIQIKKYIFILQIFLLKPLFSYIPYVRETGYTL